MRTRRFPGLGFSRLPLILGLACSALSGQTVLEDKVFGEYRQFWWTDAEGLPQNSVYSIDQTPDGYLWFGTGEGLARFDGLRFTVFGSRELKMPWPQVTSLLHRSDGALWIGDRSGAVASLREDSFSAIRRASERAYLDQITGMLEDPGGAVWMATDSSGLLRWRHGEITVFSAKDGLPGTRIETIALDAEGGLWIGTNAGLAVMNRGVIRKIGASEGIPEAGVTALSVDRSGEIWVAVGNSLFHGKGGAFSRVSAVDRSVHAIIRTLLCDRENRLWIGTEGRGIALLDRDKLLTGPGFGLVAKDRVRSMFQDADGNIWVGMWSSGLCELRRSMLQVYGERSGITGEVRALRQTRDGAIWLGAETGIYKVRGDAVEPFQPGRDMVAYSMAEDASGDLWVADRFALARIHEGKLLRLSSKVFPQPGATIIKAIHCDRKGNVWVGNGRAGVCIWRDGGCRYLTTANGLASNLVTNFHEDAAGAIWIATMGGLSRFQDGAIQSWTMKDGLPTNFIISFFSAGPDSLWIGTQHGGLVRFRDGRFRTVTTDNGLVADTAFQIVPDDFGNVWMSSNTGIYRAGLNELEACASGLRKSVRSFAYGTADGMLTRECDQAVPAGWKSGDGRLWFATLKGLVAIDPKLMGAERAPGVVVERASVDGRPVPTGSGVAVGGKRESLAIRYTALFCDRPSQARFKVKMDGLDADWMDMGSSRQVNYSHLPPGDYTFRVIADNGDGVWNNGGASLRVRIEAPFYKTAWFLWICSLALAAGIALSWRLRVAALIRARAAHREFSRRLIQSQEQERKRLAGELHDGLAQRLTIVKNLLSMRRDSATNGNYMAIAEEVTESLREVREISYALRPYQIDYLGLKEALQSLQRKVAESSGIAFTYSCDDVNGDLSKEAQINLYRIVQECLQNIVKHSGARHASVKVAREARSIRLEVVDDGVGFKSGLAGANGVGLGLTSIAERVELLNGNLSIQSEPGGGTAVRVEVGFSGGE